MRRRAACAGRCCSVTPDAWDSVLPNLKSKNALHYKCTHDSWTFMLMQHPLFPYLIWKPKQTWRMNINISRPTQTHKNVLNERAEHCSQGTILLCPTPITLSIWSCYGDDNYSWSAGYSNYCNKNHVRLVTTCERQGLSLQLCTLLCPPPPFKVGCWRVFCCNYVVKDMKFNYFSLILPLQDMIGSC